MCIQKRKKKKSYLFHCRWPYPHGASQHDSDVIRLAGIQFVNHDRRGIGQLNILAVLELAGALSPHYTIVPGNLGCN